MNKKLMENMSEYMNALNNGVNCKLMVNVTTGNGWTCLQAKIRGTSTKIKMLNV